MSGWLTGIIPGNLLSSVSNLSAPHAIMENRGLTTDLASSPIVSSSVMAPPPSESFVNSFRNARTTNFNTEPPPIRTAEYSPPLGQGDLEVQLHQMLGALTSMMQSLPSTQSFMAYNPSPNPPPNPYGTAPMPAQSMQPPITVGGVGIPMGNGGVGMQGLMAIDMGINLSMSQINSSLASVGLYGR